MNAFKVLVVDDSPFMRKVFSDLITKDGAFLVVATAADGAEALARTHEHHPDIVTMDLEMPQMNGLESLRRIMAECPTPVIMMSAVTDRGTRDTIKALQYGALDFIRKPDGSVKLDIAQVGDTLLEKLHEAAELVRSGSLRLRHHPQEEAEPEGETDAEPVYDPVIPVTRQEIVDPPAEVIAELERPKTEYPQPELKPRPKPDMQPRAPALQVQSKAMKTEDQVRSKGIERDKSKGGLKPQAEMPVTKSKWLPTSGPTRPLSNIGAERIEPRPGTPSEAAQAQSKITGSAEARQVSNTAKRTGFNDLVAIGTSTGGPRALHEVLSAIPEDFPAPILIVQHMPPKFTHSLAQRLNSFSRISVREASNGETIQAGEAYLAPGGMHMTLKKEPGGIYKIVLSEEAPVSGHRPSVDRMFESLVGMRELRRHVVLMTGMGSDGAKGMKALREDAAVTLIAESEETCVVYGMPRSAIENGGAAQALPLPRIASVLVQEVGRLRH